MSGSDKPGMLLIAARPEQRRLEIVIGDFVKAELPYFDVLLVYSTIGAHLTVVQDIQLPLLDFFAYCLPHSFP